MREAKVTDLHRETPLVIDNICLSYRHDFGLLTQEKKDELRFECREWFRAILNTLGEEK